MKFHPDKCKILSVNNFNRNIFQELPFYLYPYQLQNTILDYAQEEKDLGLLVTSKFSFKAHRTYLKQLRNLISYAEPAILSTIQENDEHFI